MSHRREATAAALLAVAAVAVLASACGRATASEQFPESEYPPVGTAAPAVCPATWEQTLPPQTRSGPLVPEGATDALLCSYPVPVGQAYVLGGVRHIADPAPLVAYLNGLPPGPQPSVDEDGVETACLATGSTAHTVVLGYADRQPAIVHLACGVEQGGGRRHGEDLRVITAFFGADWNE